jgi:hypothetical protein
MASQQATKPPGPCNSYTCRLKPLLAVLLAYEKPPSRYGRDLRPQSDRYLLLSICARQISNLPIPVEKRARTTDKRIGRKALRSLALHKYAWTSGVCYTFVLNWEAGAMEYGFFMCKRREREERTLVNSGEEFEKSNMRSCIWGLLSNNITSIEELRLLCLNIEL